MLDEIEASLCQDGNREGGSHMRALIKMLAAAVALAMSTGIALAQYAGGPPTNPVYPPYPYKAGHYPTADAYYDLPPYAVINPSFYRWRFFLMAQERNRYRYMPHIFRGYTGYREDTVGSYDSSSELLSKPMSSTSPTKAEPSPSAPEPRPQAPEVSPPPAAPGPSPAPDRPPDAPGAGQ
jgi:hypothetical protein